MEYMNPRECDVNLKYAKVSAKTMTLGGIVLSLEGLYF